ncbi:major histocompatibility complex class I-related gene protein-like [Oreochromis aureus]|uniref:major histocompatibility complex class I-related gene protein-like n=1 Tax=Oreochromis aureus TaxID=47969 RepID=UPI001954A728|nr:major histocompatibility complex class I-related gene protein-like [Oreochromis aureus]
MKLFLLLLCFRGLFAAKHSLKYLLTETTGAQSIPEFVGVGFIDDVQFGSWNSRRGEDIKKDWIKFFEDEPELLQEYISECSFRHHNFKETIKTLKQHLNQTEGVHVLQRVSGCEWDNETGEVSGYNQYGYDGEDFIAFDLQTLTWITSKPQAETTKLKWNTDHARLEHNKNFVIYSCPEFLKKHWHYGRSFLEKEILPSVSLLQKTPSSPVSCHATGFYPQRAVMFWRKDGEELHESVDHGEILPNTDGTFQLSVDLNVSSVRSEDWKRYDCVFQISGVKMGRDDSIVTKLDEAVIWTNWKKPTDIMTFIGAALVVLVFTIIAAVTFVIYKRNKGEKSYLRKYCV